MEETTIDTKETSPTTKTRVLTTTKRANQGSNTSRLQQRITARIERLDLSRPITNHQPTTNHSVDRSDTTIERRFRSAIRTSFSIRFLERRFRSVLANVDFDPFLIRTSSSIRFRASISIRSFRTSISIRMQQWTTSWTKPTTTPLLPLPSNKT